MLHHEGRNKQRSSVFGSCLRLQIFSTTHNMPQKLVYVKGKYSGLFNLVLSFWTNIRFQTPLSLCLFDNTEKEGRSKSSILHSAMRRCTLPLTPSFKEFRFLNRTSKPSIKARRERGL